MFLWVLWHFSQRYIILNESLNFSIPTGSSIPLHELFLSPGFMSTCFEYKQYGQWSLAVYPNFLTFLPHFSQTKDSSIMLKVFMFNHQVNYNIYLKYCLNML